MSSSDVTRYISLIFLCLIGLGAFIALILILIKGNSDPGVTSLLGSIVGGTIALFSKASGVVDGASITQDAVNSVTGPMVTAIQANTTPAVPTTTSVVKKTTLPSG